MCRGLCSMSSTLYRSSFCVLSVSNASQNFQNQLTLQLFNGFFHLKLGQPKTHSRQVSPYGWPYWCSFWWLIAWCGGCFWWWRGPCGVAPGSWHRGGTGDHPPLGGSRSGKGGVADGRCAALSVQPRGGGVEIQRLSHIGMSKSSTLGIWLFSWYWRRMYLSSKCIVCDFVTGSVAKLCGTTWEWNWAAASWRIQVHHN